MRLGLSIAESRRRPTAPFWTAPAYRAESAGGGGAYGPAAILDLGRDRHALTIVPDADIPAALPATLTTLAAKPFSDVVMFTRAGAATYIDADGLIRVAAADQPRFDCTHGRVGLRLEPQATNLLPYSEDFSQWGIASGVGATVTSNASSSPAGNNDASLYVPDFDESPPSKAVLYYSGFAALPRYVFSTYAKRPDVNGSRYVILYTGNNSGYYNITWFDLIDGVPAHQAAHPNFGVVDSKMIAFGDGWYRCEVSASDSSWGGLVGITTTDQYTGRARSWTYDGVKGALIWGAQVEPGSVASSYIPTAGSAVTRPADKAQLTESAAALLRRGEATVLLQGRHIRPAAPPAAGRLLSGPASADSVISVSGDGTQIEGGSPSLNIAEISQPLPDFGVAVAWDAAVLKGLYSQSGSLAGRPGSQSAVLTSAFLGRNATDGGFAAGWYDKLVIWPFRMTDADLQAKAVAYD